MGVHFQTVKNWILTGKLKTFKTPTGHHRISHQDLINLKYGELERNAILYARVSSAEQKPHLEPQLNRLREYCIKNKINIGYEFSEFGSGLNSNRKKLHKSLELISARKANLLIVENKDRLTRFGFEYIDAYCKSHGCELRVVNEVDIKDDVVKDLIDIIICFSSKIYGRRSNKNKVKAMIGNLNND